MKIKLLLSIAVIVFVIGNLYLLRGMLDNPTPKTYQDNISLIDKSEEGKPSSKSSIKLSPQSVPAFQFPDQKQSVKNYTIAVLVIACNRPSVKRCVDLLIRNRPSESYYPIVVSQDCGDEKTADVLKSYGNRIKYLKFTPSSTGGLSGYHKIARHYKWALDQAFNVLNYESVIIVEDDLDIAPDFFSYFQATRHLMDQDKTIWCASAWNDNGRRELVTSQERLYRSDFFPGLGWMLTKNLWKEIGPKWPAAYWDDWLREPVQRRNRVCIRPEISRTRTFGRIGVSQGQFFDRYLKHINLNTGKVDFMSRDLSYLIKENYDDEFLGTVHAAPVITFSQLLANTGPTNPIVRIKYKTHGSFIMIAQRIGLMTDFKAGVPRTAYKGIVSFTYKNKWVHLVPSSA